MRFRVGIIGDLAHVRPEQCVALTGRPDTFVRLQKNHRVRCDVIHYLHTLQRCFPVIPIRRVEEVMTHLSRRHALNHVTRFQRVNYHSVDFLLPSVHFHLPLVGEQLPSIATISDTLPSLEQLLRANFVNLGPKLVTASLGSCAEVLCLLLIIVSLLVGGENGTIRTNL